MKPTIGRIVHYTNLGDRDGKYPPEVQAALITRVHGTQGWNVALHVFYPTGQFDMPDVKQAPENVLAGSEEARGMWQWPAREG
jgi:hypothetical protein